MFFRFLNCIIPTRIQNLMRMRFFQQVFSRILNIPEQSTPWNRSNGNRRTGQTETASLKMQLTHILWFAFGWIRPASRIRIYMPPLNMLVCEWLARTWLRIPRGPNILNWAKNRTIKMVSLKSVLQFPPFRTSVFFWPEYSGSPVGQKTGGSVRPD